jgi:hypothetical protein
VRLRDLWAPAMPVLQPCLATSGLRDKKDAASALPDAVSRILMLNTLT